MNHLPSLIARANDAYIPLKSVLSFVNSTLLPLLPHLVVRGVAGAPPWVPKSSPFYLTGVRTWCQASPFLSGQTPLVSFSYHPG